MNDDIDVKRLARAMEYLPPVWVDVVGELLDEIERLRGYKEEKTMKNEETEIFEEFVNGNYGEEYYKLFQDMKKEAILYAEGDLQKALDVFSDKMAAWYEFNTASESELISEIMLALDIDYYRIADANLTQEDIDEVMPEKVYHITRHEVYEVMYEVKAKSVDEALSMDLDETNEISKTHLRSCPNTDEIEEV